ncbi:hypothetical protein KAI65_01830 [Candidatus Parcubacteria bacterium]|nr:hypothetical protein [Candidatus Parcubacteria bacterium]
MPKKISVQNATHQKLLKKVLSSLKFSLNLVGAIKIFKNINALIADIFGAMRICSVCSQEK